MKKETGFILHKEYKYNKTDVNSLDKKQKYTRKSMRKSQTA